MNSATASVICGSFLFFLQRATIVIKCHELQHAVIEFTVGTRPEMSQVL